MRKVYSSFTPFMGIPTSGLFLLALLVRVVYALQINFPPLDDPAYYIQAAKALGGPHPLDFEVSIIWNFQPRFETVQHAGMEFWMPLSSFTIAFSSWLFGSSFFAAQLPSIVAGASLPVFTYAFARRFMPPGLSFVSGLLVALNPLLAYQSALPDSSMLYAALVCPALLLIIRLRETPEKPQPWLALAFGLLTGLAYLARTPAIFLALTYFGYTIFDLRLRGSQSSTIFAKKQNRKVNFSSLILRPSSLNLLLVILGMGVPVGLWSLRNLFLFGFISSPAGTETIFLFDYQDLFNYRTPVNFGTWLEGGPGKIIGVRLEALWSAWRNVLDVISPPTVVLGTAGLVWLFRREKAARPPVIYSLLLFLGVPLIFAVASLNGSYYHSAGSSAPFLSAGQVYLLWQGISWFRTRKTASSKVEGTSEAKQVTPSFLLTVLLSVLVLLNGALLPLNAAAAIEVHSQEAEFYGRIKSWLDAHPAPVVITNQPATLNYVSGQPSVRLPANEDLATLGEVARKYGARYIIVTEVAGRYPALLDSPDNTLFPHVYNGGDFEVFAVP